jgi:hypothetical protein
LASLKNGLTCDAKMKANASYSVFGLVQRHGPRVWVAIMMIVTGCDTGPQQGASGPPQSTLQPAIATAPHGKAFDAQAASVLSPRTGCLGARRWVARRPLRASRRHVDMFWRGTTPPYGTTGYPGRPGTALNASAAHQLANHLPAVAAGTDHRLASRSVNDESARSLTDSLTEIKGQVL